jgi:hypothetical protein
MAKIISENIMEKIYYRDFIILNKHNPLNHG